MTNNYAALALCLAVSACGGSGSNSPAFDPAKEVRRIGAITKAALDFGSLFLPITQNYLQARSTAGSLSCPQSGSFDVASTATGQYTVAYTQCNVGWTTLAGTVDLTTSSNDLIANFDLTWDGVHYQGALRLMNAATATPSGLYLVGDHATMTLTSGQVYNLYPNLRLQDNGNQIYTFIPSNEIFLDQQGGALNLIAPIGSATQAAHVQGNLLDGSGNFLRIDPPYDGNLTYTRGTQQVVYDGNMIDANTGFSVSFDNVTTSQNNIASAMPTWNAVLANPIYSPTD